MNTTSTTIKITLSSLMKPPQPGSTGNCPITGYRQPDWNRKYIRRLAGRWSESSVGRLGE
ncbi:hypothetical protein [Photorhabdus heterorhabditis]|nr:hypothetical protein [Photorhabdus heterorhabditis]